jgi:hypothetical protein
MSCARPPPRRLQVVENKIVIMKTLAGIMPAIPSMVAISSMVGTGVASKKMQSHEKICCIRDDL